MSGCPKVAACPLVDPPWSTPPLNLCLEGCRLRQTAPPPPTRSTLLQVYFQQQELSAVSPTPWVWSATLPQLPSRTSGDIGSVKSRHVVHAGDKGRRQPLGLVGAAFCWLARRGGQLQQENV